MPIPHRPSSAATCCVLLVWSSVVVPALPPSPAVRTAANLAGTTGLVAAARAGGLSWAELGIDRGTWRAGVRRGSLALGLASAGYLAALAVPASRAALARSAVTPGRELAVRGLVAIPLGTVLCEEAAFRGVLLAAATRDRGARAAGVLTALTFGLWHVRTALDASDAPTPLRRWAAAAGTAVLTALGGGVLGRERVRTGSLLAPVGLHLGTNGAGLLAATVADRVQRRTGRRARGACQSRNT